MNETPAAAKPSSVLRAPARVLKLAILPLIAIGMVVVGAGTEKHAFELTGELGRSGMRMGGTDEHGCKLTLESDSVIHDEGRVELPIEIELTVDEATQSVRDTLTASRAIKRIRERETLHITNVLGFVTVPHPLRGRLWVHVSEASLEPKTSKSYQRSASKAELTARPFRGADVATAFNRWAELEAVPKWIAEHALELWVLASLASFAVFGAYLWKARQAFEASDIEHALARDDEWLFNPYQDRPGYGFEALLKMAAFVFVLSSFAAVGMDVADVDPVWGTLAKFAFIGGMVMCAGFALAGVTPLSSDRMKLGKTVTAVGVSCATLLLFVEIRFA